MAFEKLKNNLIDADADMKHYLESSEEYFKLKLFKVLMRSVTMIAGVMLIATIVVLALFMLSIGLSFAINEMMGSYYYGFIIMGLVYVFIAILCYLFRDRLNRPILRRFSKLYFS